MWRPEGWERPYWMPPSFEDSIGREFRWKREGKAKGEIFEEGADAILKFLFKLAEESPTGTFVIDPKVINVYREAQ